MDFDLTPQEEKFRDEVRQFIQDNMKEEGVTSEMFLMDWNLSLFTRALPLEVAANVWDMFLLQGKEFLFLVSGHQ